MRLYYMAHPVGRGRETVAANVRRAKAWLAWLVASSPPDVVILAPWLHEAEVCGHDGEDELVREQILARCEAVVARCDAILLVGGRISPGMAREAAVAASVHDLTALGDDPPGGLP